MEAEKEAAAAGPRCPFPRLGAGSARRRRHREEAPGSPPPAAARERLAGIGTLRRNRLRLLALLAPLVFVGLLEWARDMLYPSLQTLPGRLLMDGVVLAGLLFFYGAVFAIYNHLQDRLARQNRELLALHRAGLDIYGDLDLDRVLQKVVEQACSLVEARYGALAVIDEEGRIQSFVTSGISDELRARIGPPPAGKGLLGMVLHEGQRLRIPEIRDDPRSAGLPPHHPPMHSLLAVPILCEGPFRGNLYLAEKESAPEFTPEDEETLVRFAVKAAIAIDNAHLHQRLRTLAVAEERLRIAHEMHDGQAQILAYVNTKAQAVQQFLNKGRVEEANRQLAELAAAAREVYDDVREGILGLRASAGGEGSVADTLRLYIEQWQDRAGVEAELAAEPSLRLDPAVELQLVRIVQEALTNIRKHAAARRARVTLERLGSRLRLGVEDDGIGFDPATHGRSALPRFGLATMRERAESIGGSFRLQTAAGEGTRIEVEIPVPTSPAAGERSSYASSHR